MVSKDVEERLEIRPETLSDFEQVSDVNRSAFGREAEARLIEEFRKYPEYVSDLSLVASLHDERVVGHVLFSPVHVQGCDSDVRVMGLGPIAVTPEYQGMGIGARLIEAGLVAAKRSGACAVVVLGHPTYYARFGFQDASKSNLRLPFEHEPGAFMIVALTGGLESVSGTVKYHCVFDMV